MNKTYLKGILILMLAIAAVNTSKTKTHNENEDVAQSAQANNNKDDGISSANSVNKAQSISSANAEPIRDAEDENKGYTGDQYDDISARWNYIKSYSTQTSSPMQMRPTLDEIEEGITEYGYSFWMKWDFLWNDEHSFDIAKSISHKIEVAFLSQHENSSCSAHDGEWDEDELKNTMNLYISLKHNKPQLVTKSRKNKTRFDFPNGNYDNVWTFVHFSYSAAAQKFVMGVKFQNSDFVVKTLDGLMPPVNEDQKLYFRLANSEDNHDDAGFQGFFKEVSFTHGKAGQGGYLETQNQLQAFWSGLSQYNPITEPQQGTVKLSQQIVGTTTDNSLTVSNQITKMVNNISYPSEYSIGGWMQVKAGTQLDATRVLLYRVGTKNHAIGGDSNELGETTFMAEIDATHITFSTYTISDLDNIETLNEVQVPIKVDDYQNDFYVYQGYSRDAKLAVAYLQTYDQDGNGVLEVLPATSKETVHMRSKDFQISLGKDKDHNTAFEGEVSCLNFRFGPKSFISDQIDLDALVKQDMECVAEGEQDVSDKKQRTLESYTKKGMFASHGDPTFVTDDQIANMYIIDGLIGDPDTVSLRSALKENGVERSDFYFRHSGGLIRESKTDGSEAFKKQASWIVHKDKFIDGTVAIESADKRGYYWTRVDWVVKLAKEGTTEEFKGNASWNFEDQHKETPCDYQPKLVPVFRLRNPTTMDEMLAVSEEKIGAMKSQGYENYNQEGSDSNIVGYGWEYNRDGNATPIMEYVNPNTGFHIYTTSPNSLPEGYQFNFIIVYGYKALYRGTIPVVQYNRSEKIKGDRHYTSSGTEINSCHESPNDFSGAYKAFWLYGTTSDPSDNKPEGPECESDVQKCGPFVPEECQDNNYRSTQEGDCKICDGEIKPYAGTENDKLYTGSCITCDGGWELVDGVRKCRKCPNGQWVLESGETEKTCYPNCDAKTNMYLSFPSYKCEKCAGELEKHSTQANVSGLNECKSCTMGTEIKDGKQVCKTCSSGWVETKMKDETYVCIRTCPQANQYVTDKNDCKVCTGGFVYDDGTTTKRCAADPKEGTGPFNYPWNEESPYEYVVDGDQTDDIKEMSFSVWIRFQTLNPTFFNFGAWGKNPARIGGFTTDKGQVSISLAKSDSSKETQAFQLNGINAVDTTDDLSSRQAFEHEWILVHVSQGSDSLSAYIFASQSKQTIFKTVKSQTPEEFKSITFSLGRKQGDTLAPLGFQGQYQNLNLRFAVQGLYQETANDAKSFLNSIGLNQNTIPQRTKAVNIHKIFNGQQVDLSEKSEAEKTFVFDNLSGTQSYAVYGWFKLDTPKEGEKVIAGLHTNLFNLKDRANDATSNEIGLVPKIGDYALHTSIKNCDLQFDSYTTTLAGHGGYTKINSNVDASLEEETFERWFFVYQAYNGVTNQRWAYMSSIMEKEELWEMNNKEASWHLRPDSQVFTLGFKSAQGTSSSVPFKGSVKGVNVVYGEPCEYKNEQCMNALFHSADKPTPDPWGSCVIMYTEPNYKGNFVYNCYENESFNIDIKSIYIPEGVEYKIWNQTSFRGLSVIYSRSQENLDRINFELLLAQQVEGMEVVKSDRYFELIGINQKAEVIPAPQEKVVVNEAIREQVTELDESAIPQLVKKKAHLRKQF